MPKSKRIYQCQSCSHESLQWSGQCNVCQAWNSFIELERVSDTAPSPKNRLKNDLSKAGYAGGIDEQAGPIELNEVLVESIPSLPTGLEELDRVLGHGIVAGAVVLLGGDPGIGKSTLLLQMLNSLKAQASSLYVTGEESLQQIAMRAQRLNIKTQAGLKLFSETHLESIIQQAMREKPKIMVIDSIQTIYTDTIAGAPGSITQLRECTAYLTRYAKQTGTALFLTGHVTKEGGLAGPRILEHIVDTVLYFEGESHQKIRLIRAIG